MQKSSMKFPIYNNAVPEAFNYENLHKIVTKKVAIFEL